MPLSDRPRTLLRQGMALVTLLVGMALSAQNGKAQSLQNGWLGYGSNPQHTCLSKFAAQSLKSVHWSLPIDLTLPADNSNTGTLLIHYTSPLVTPRNTVIATVRTNANNNFRLEGHRSSDGTLLWTQTTDYLLPPHNWIPPCGSTLTPNLRLYTPAAGGTILYRDGVDSTANVTPTRLCFYTSLANYTANKSNYDSKVFINTPLTSDANGNIYFGFQVIDSNPPTLPITSGIARISSNGVATWVPLSPFISDGNTYKAIMNCAPALSNDGKTLYVGINVADFSSGYLLALDSRLTNNGVALPAIGAQFLFDPHSSTTALLTDNSSGTPMVGPDGDVYFGVLESPFLSHHDRGWLLHFNSTLSQIKTPGSFGWDDTPSIVPAAMVPSYKGTSSYLIMCKYNDYAGFAGGSGVNRIAILDPNASQPDFMLPTVSVMKEVQMAAGITPDPDNVDANHPNAVKEWCINSAAIDPFTKCVIANSEDGWLYRWDMTTNTLTEKVQVTGGVGEAYTPTVIGPDGIAYAINNGRLWAVGK